MQRSCLAQVADFYNSKPGKVVCQRHYIAALKKMLGWLVYATDCEEVVPSILAVSVVLVLNCGGVVRGLGILVVEESAK